jgi:hypothetical protein
MQQPTSPEPIATPADAGPVGVPPGGGSWTWDAASRAWVSLDDIPAAAPATDTPATTQE